MRDKVKRFISILMTALMLVNLMPVGALADGFTSGGYQQATIANGNQTVYLYVKVTGNLNGLNLNKSGWCTVGKVTGLNMTDPQSYAWWYGSSNHVSSVSGISASSVGKGKVDRWSQNQSIDLSKVTWSSGTSYGFLPVSTGADDYVGSGWTWHLDGYIDISQVKASYKIRYVDQDTNNVLKIAASGTDDPGVWIDHSAPKTLEGGYEIVGDTDRTFKLEQIDNTFDIYYRRQYGYKVEYYYDGVKDGEKTETGSAWCKDVIRQYTDKTDVGYEIEKAENFPLTIQADESKNVIKVYYKKIGYTVTYEPGEHGTFTAKAYNAKYGDNTPAFDGETTGKPGWTFDGWEPEVAKTVTGNATYTAKWTQNEYTVTYVPGDHGTFDSQSYNKKHYGDKTPAFDGETTGEPGWTFAGWTPDVAETVTGDATYTAKWTQNEYTVTYVPGDHGTFDSQSYNKKHYGDDTPAFVGETTGEPGWTFAGWEPEVADTVTGNATYTAKFVPDKTKTATVLYTISIGQSDYGSIAPSAQQIILQATGKLDSDVGGSVSGSTATANAGYKFVGWYKATGEATYEWVTGDPELTSELAEAKLNRDEETGLYQNTVFEARFEPDEKQTATVTYTAENGTVDNASDTILQADASGLTGSTALANTGYKFDGWYNGTDFITKELTLTPEMAKPKLNKNGNLYAATTFIARFVPDTKQSAKVIYTTDGNGKLDKSFYKVTQFVQIVTGEVVREDGSVIGDKLTTIRAYPNDGYEFDRWVKVIDENNLQRIDGADFELKDEQARPNLNQKDGLYQKTEFRAIFKPQTNLSYTVNYYWNGNHQNPIKSESGTATYGQIVNPKTDVSGYTLMPEQETSLTIGAKENVLNLYYYKNVKLKANSDEKTYDGKPKSVSDYTCEVAKVQEDGTVEYVPWTGEKLTFKFVGAFGSGTDAGDYDVTFKEGSVGENNGLYYVKEVQPGTLTIKPALIKLRAPIASKPYDGTPLKAEDYGYGYEGNTDLADDFKSISVEGSQTMVGNSASSVTYTLKDRKKPQNYDIQCIPGTLTITPATDKVTVTITGNKVTETYDGSVKTASGYGVSTTNEKYTEADFTFTGKAEVKKTDAGTYAMGLKAEQFTNTSANFTNVEFVVTDGSLTINKRPVMLASANLTKVYDGTELKNGETPVTEMFGTEKAFPENEGLKYTFTGGQTDVGKSANTFTYKPKNASTKLTNYTFEVAFGMLEVTPVTEEVVVTITGHNNTVTYNGSEQSVTGYDVTIPEGSLYTENDFEFTGEASDKTASGTNAQEEAYAMGLKAEHFRNKNTNFKNVTFKITDGWLVINPRAVTLTSSDAEKVYDGQPLTKDEVKVSGDGFVEGEGATYNVTGTVTEVKDSPATNTFTYKLNKGTEAKNYNIELAPGKLTVTPVETEVVVTITGRTDEMPYDGKEHSVSGYDVTVSNELYKPKEDMQFNGFDEDMTAKGTDAGTYPMKLTAEDFTNKSDNFSKVTFVVTDGYVKINPRAVTLTSETAGKTYDGKPLEKPVVTVGGDGFVEGQVKEIKATGSVTNAGSVANTITFTPNKETFKEGNYAITKTEGTLTIAKRSVLISSQSATKTYDGEALTRPAVTITGDGFVPGELAKAEATGSITKVGSTPNTIQYTTTGAFNAANYSIALSVGTLTVTEKPQPEPRRTFNLTINYVYQNGKRAASSYNRGGLKNGETFDITSPVIAGYTASETVVSGTIYNRDIKVTVIYTADGVNLDDYGVPLGLGNITMNVGDCFE